MTTSNPAALIPVVAFERHSAPKSWTAAQRAELAERLARVGTTITELSDARERCGHARLSEGTDWDRANAHLNVECPEIAAAIVALRLEHIELVRELGDRNRKAVSEARRLLGLKGGYALRIAELQALCCQSRIVEILAEPEARAAHLAAVRAQAEKTTRRLR